MPITNGKLNQPKEGKWLPERCPSGTRPLSGHGIRFVPQGTDAKIGNVWAGRGRSAPESVKVPLPGTPPWTDQDIVLYHGTLDVHVTPVLGRVNLAVCQHLRDFGRGFYTTTNRDQAVRWANDLAVQIPGGIPAVIEFTVERNDLTRLDCLIFIRGTPAAADYWSFVQYCRTTARDHNRKHTGWYDIVAGPVSGSWKNQTVIPDGDQVSFHTKTAISVLNQSTKRRVV